MTNRLRGLLVATGGVFWLLGVLVLQLSVFDPAVDSLPVAFSLLALLAGLFVMWGCWGAAPSLDSTLARVGLRLVGACAAALGAGFGLDLIPDMFDMFLAFLLAYTAGLFVLPVAFLVLGLGVRTSGVFPGWAKWVPFLAAGTAVVTYGFHALARDVWDPSDAVWYTAIGGAWVLLGFGLMGVANARAEDDTPRILGPSA